MNLSEDKIRYYSVLDKGKNLNVLEDPYFAKYIDENNKLKYSWRYDTEFKQSNPKSKQFNRVVFCNKDEDKAACYIVSQKSKFINSAEYLAVPYMGANVGVKNPEVDNVLALPPASRNFQHINITNYEMDRFHIQDINYQDKNHSVMPGLFSSGGYPTRTISKYHKYKM